MQTAVGTISVENIVTDLFMCFRNAVKGPATLTIIISALKISYDTELNYSSLFSPVYYVSGHAKIARGVDRLINELSAINLAEAWTEKSADTVLKAIQNFIVRRDLKEEANNRIVREIIRKVWIDKNATITDQTLSALLMHNDTESLRAEFRVTFQRPIVQLPIAAPPAILTQFVQQVRKGSSDNDTMFTEEGYVEDDLEPYPPYAVAQPATITTTKETREITLEDRIALNIY